MAGIKMDICSYEHTYFWKKHKDKVLSKFFKKGKDPKKLALIVERVNKDWLNRDWEHRCKDCNSCTHKGYIRCKSCECLHFFHSSKNVYFFTEYFNGCYYRLIFYKTKKVC